MPKARTRTGPNSASRIMNGFCVPHPLSVNWVVFTKRMSPEKVPSVVASNCTVSVSSAPGARTGASGSIRLKPLGNDYCNVLLDGLSSERWCDRYPNQGKQSGAFSCGSFDGNPYILMNYKPEVLDDVFTLAHEAGHSMHSYYSAKHQPFTYYNYTIFVAEVASTFNEQLEEVMAPWVCEPVSFEEQARLRA